MEWVFVKGRVRRRPGLVLDGASWLLVSALVSVSLATRGQADIRGLVTA
jgi:hypothetical protein